MRSKKNSHCLNILRQLSHDNKHPQYQTNQSESKINANVPFRLMPHTARKLVFTQEDRADLIQTVRCKAVGRYIAEETPALPEEFCPSSDLPRQPEQQSELQAGYHQVDAIFTELEDCLIDIKSKFTARVKAQMSNQAVTDGEKRMRCDHHLKNMKNLLHYIKQVTEDFLQQPPNRNISHTNPSRNQQYLTNCNLRLRLFHS